MGFRFPVAILRLAQEELVYSGIDFTTFTGHLWGGVPSTRKMQFLPWYGKLVGEPRVIGAPPPWWAKFAQDYLLFSFVGLCLGSISLLDMVVLFFFPLGENGGRLGSFGMSLRSDQEASSSKPPPRVPPRRGALRRVARCVPSLAEKCQKWQPGSQFWGIPQAGLGVFFQRKRKPREKLGAAKSFKDTWRLNVQWLWVGARVVRVKPGQERKIIKVRMRRLFDHIPFGD